MIKTSLIRLGKKVGLAFGLDIRRTKSADFNYEWLKRQDIQTILDIGANVGQFAKRIHKILPEAKIYSFEPLRDCYLKLVSNLKALPKFQAFNYALGEADDNDVEMHRSQFSASSSFLRMADLHKRAFPYTEVTAVEKVTVRRLDGISHELDLEDGILIKIDVQGFEDKVIAGGAGLIARAKVVIIEANTERLYEGQASFDKTYRCMTHLGFHFKGLWDQLKNPVDGRILSCDAIFMRESG